MAMKRVIANYVYRMTAIDCDLKSVEGRSRALAIGALECLEDAKSLSGVNNVDTTGCLILTFHALELSLKSFLVKKGISEEILLKNYSHDLLKLYKKSRNLGLSLHEPDMLSLLESINEWHKAKRKIYFEFALNRKLPACQTLFPIVNKVLEASK